MTTSERLTKARMGVILSAPFFGSLLMRLKMVPDDTRPTMCTDGRVIRYNEQFVRDLKDEELRGVLAHEVAHCAQGHCWRLGSRNPQKWNHATDYQINEMLEQYVAEERKSFEARHGHGRFIAPWSLPEGGLKAPEFRGMASEEIYHRLPDGSGSGSPSVGAVEAPAGSPAEEEELAREWQVAVTQAVAAEKARGSVPECLKRLVSELLAPKVPWREVLREFVRRMTRDDYSWRRPNRRYLHAGVVLPSLQVERMGRLAIAVDTSGSIGDRELSEFQAEIQAALDECAPEAIDVIYCDAAVQHTEEFLPGDAVQLSPRGGGGTCFGPVFDHLEQAEEPPVALIYLTDGFGSFPAREPDYPVLWASTASENFPFGEIVSIK